MNKLIGLAVLSVLLLNSCKKSGGGDDPGFTPLPASFALNSWEVNGTAAQQTYYNIPVNPIVRLKFSGPIDKNTVNSSITLKELSGSSLPITASYSNADSTITFSPTTPLQYLKRYQVTLANSLKSTNGASLQVGTSFQFLTTIDSSRKFPQISEDSLLTLVQKQTFKYFWDFAHPVSGLARERNTSGDLVTSGGSGFGIMAIVTGIHRGFITRAQGLARMQTIVSFLKNNAQKFHGAFPHWLNGTTGNVIPFSSNDNGADLVETSFLLQGLLTARQYFSGNDATETALRSDINSIWHGVEWNWFRKNNENVLYWHWSPTAGFAINLKIKGWNESMIVYTLAASSPTHSIPKVVYDEGWASNGSMINSQSYYGVTLPLGPPLGGPLFFSHYSFLGTDPNGLTDAYANYKTQNTNHALINYNYCVANPAKQFGYSDSCWGLTASDIPNGYTASSPTNDRGVIAPTAALSSFPYTPTQSMKALKFFYFVLGDKIWKEYGFVDAFSLKEPWFATSFLAIDQGPIIAMIENHRSGLLWNLFMSCPEVKTGMQNLGFQSPHF